MPYLECSALVTGNRPSGETSAVVTFMTDHLGILKLRVRGAMADYRKIRQSLDTFTLSELILFENRSGSISLRDQSITETYPEMRNYFSDMLAAYRLVEFFSALSVPGRFEGRLFNELCNTLKELDRTAGSGRNRILLPIAELAALEISGIGQDPLICVDCGKSAEPLGIFSPARGGFVCHDCKSGNEPVKRWPSSIQQKIRVLISNDPEEINISPLESMRIAEFVRSRFRYHMDDNRKYPACDLYLRYA